MPEARANTPKKGQDPARVAGGRGGGLVKHEPQKTITQNDNPGGPCIPKEARAWHARRGPYVLRTERLFSDICLAGAFVRHGGWGPLHGVQPLRLMV